MLLNKALLFYFFIALIFLVTVIILNSTQKKDHWLKKLPQQEQKLYKLEKEALVNNNELDMTKAKLYYEERTLYCQSIESDKQTLCFKRTQPFWDNLYKRKTLPDAYHKE